MEEEIRKVSTEGLSHSFGEFTPCSSSSHPAFYSPSDKHYKLVMRLTNPSTGIEHDVCLYAHVDEKQVKSRSSEQMADKIHQFLIDRLKNMIENSHDLDENTPLTLDLDLICQGLQANLSEVELSEQELYEILQNGELSKVRSHFNRLSEEAVFNIIKKGLGKKGSKWTQETFDAIFELACPDGAASTAEGLEKTLERLKEAESYVDRGDEKLLVHIQRRQKGVTNLINLQKVLDRKKHRDTY